MRSYTRSRPLQAAALTLACLALARGLSAQLVTTESLENAAADNSSWLTYGRDYYGQRFVRLEQITPRTSAGSARRGSSRPAARTAACRRRPWSTTA